MPRKAKSPAGEKDKPTRIRHLWEVPQEFHAAVKSTFRGSRYLQLRRYLLRTIDDSRYAYSADWMTDVNTRLIEAWFGSDVRKRVKAFLDKCVKSGLLVEDPRYIPGTPEKPGYPKKYGVNRHFLRQMPNQHRDGGDGVGGARDEGSRSLSDKIARCLNPKYIKMRASDVTAMDEAFGQASLSLGWDCARRDMTSVTDVLLSRVVVTACRSDIDSYFHARGPVRIRRWCRKSQTKVTRVYQPSELADELWDVVDGYERGTRYVSHRKDGRCYHVLTSIPGALRSRFVRFVDEGGELRRAVDVDISAAYASFLVSLMEEGEQKRQLQCLAEHGELYESLCDAMVHGGAIIPEADDRRAFKRTFNTFMIFGDWSTKARVSLRIGLEATYPDLHRVLWQLNTRKTPRQRSKVLTRMEGSIMLDRALPRLMARGVYPLPYHDGFLVREDDEEVVTNEVRLACREVLGFVPCVRTKTEAVSSDDLEAMFEITESELEHEGDE